MIRVHDIRDLRLDELRAMIRLFDGTIADNLRIARPMATKGEIEAACRAAQIHSFVAGLPRGYDTEVGERGARLSPSAIARADRIVILDGGRVIEQGRHDALIRRHGVYAQLLAAGLGPDG